LRAAEAVRTLDGVSVALDSDMAAIPALPIRRLTVAQYDAMGAAGILTADDRVELLDGWLVDKMTKKPPHRIATRRALEVLLGVVPAGWYVDSHEPIVTADSEPEPDLAVLRGKIGDYSASNPPACAVVLVVEVADDSLARDRATKGSIYARARIPAYWIVNVVDRWIEVYTAPVGDGADAHYASRVDHPAGTVSFSLDGAVFGVRVEDVL
jgi:Uma2 family endonuclease